MAKTKGTGRAKRPTGRGDPLAERIVDETLALAEEVSWEGVRLRLVAERCGVALPDVLAHYRDIDAVADAWFGRAWAAMVAPPRAGFADLPARERLYLVLTRWFDALAPHRAVSVEMIRAKIYLSHPHHWVPLIFNLSRTVHWVRDAAGLDATGRRRQAEEVGLTLLFLATLAVWARDDSDGQERTRDFLKRRLADADWLMARLYG
jgi:AcrR family transcriptional regulator